MRLRRLEVGVIVSLFLFFASLLPQGGTAREPGEASPAVREPRAARQDPFVRRPFRPLHGERWIGNAVAYGPYRDGQFPGGPTPTREEIRQDLHLLSRSWSLLRLYGAVGPAETILDVIREDGLDLKVMLGIWIGSEERYNEKGQRLERFPETRRSNRQEIEAAVRLARTYSGIVLAVCVGNETQVSWSDHRVPRQRLIGFVREVRSRVRQPVSVADDFNFWNEPESRAVAREVDFLVTHAHPLWNGIEVARALEWTEKTYDSVRSFHPDHTVLLGETGWATQKHDEGEQARLIRGEPGEDPQARYHAALTEWAARRQVTVFFFEAFDENWKGDSHPQHVEKHWGLYRADRKPKKAMLHEK